MTRLVEFTRDMAPFRRGDRYALPDKVAAKIEAEGDGKIVDSVFDAPPIEPQRPGKLYLTRKAR